MAADKNDCWWFILGREPLLSVAEILAAVPGSNIAFFQPPILCLEGDLDSEKLMSRLGGTIKIGKELSRELTEAELLESLENELQKVSGKITYGISFYSSNDSVEKWGKHLKKSLRQKGRSARYVYKREPTLSSVTVSANGLIRSGREFLILEKNELFSCAVTTAIQPFSAFSERDYGRPGRDAKSGMLPPKLALMLINLANVGEGETLLDPSCGSGTIITEALLRGKIKVIGSDVSPKAIADCQQNLDWMIKTNPQIEQAEKRIFEADVRTLGSTLAGATIDAIVTEPYLGKPLRGNESRQEIMTGMKELSELYLKSFEEFKKILRPGGKVVFVIPQFVVKGVAEKISVELVPKIQKMGFSVPPLLPKLFHAEPFVLYKRPGQLVGREIWKFILD